MLVSNGKTSTAQNRKSTSSCTDSPGKTRQGAPLPTCDWGTEEKNGRRLKDSTPEKGRKNTVEARLHVSRTTKDRPLSYQ